MGEKVQALTEHYQKTFELTYEMWRERNKIFVLLLVVIGVALLLALHIPGTNSLLVDAIVKFLGITDPARINQLYNTFPFDVLLSILLVDRHISIFG